MVALLGAAVVAGAVIVPILLANRGGAPSGPELATASRRTFSVVSNGTGILVPRSQFGLNFSAPGRVTDIDVTVGQRVTAGQLIARIDSGPQQAVVASDLATVQVLQAALDHVLNPLAPGEAEALQGDIAALQGLSNDTAAAITSAATQDATEAAARFQLVISAEERFAADGCTRVTNRTSAQIRVCDVDRADITRAQDELARAQTRQRDSGLVAHQPQLDQTTVDLARTLGQLATDSVPVPALVDEARARVAAAQADLQKAEADLTKTSIVAPGDATVLAINGETGEMETPQPSGSQSAPGSTAPLPKPQALLPGALPESTTLAVNSNAFAVLGDPGVLQAAVPFPEADAVRLAPGQPGTLTVAAVPGLEMPVRVVGVSPTATAIAGAVEYFATVALDHRDPRLKDGMTTDLSITTAVADNVLAVPERALYVLDNKYHVDVWYGGRIVPTEVQVGVVGRELAQITSGLTEGQQVVLSLRHPLPTPPAPRPTQNFFPTAQPQVLPYTNTSAQLGRPASSDLAEGPDPSR